MMKYDEIKKFLRPDDLIVTVLKLKLLIK